MWSFKSFRFCILAVAVFAVAGCGFRPLYGKQAASPVSAGLSSIRIAPIADRLGQQLHNHLLDFLNTRGRPTNPAYHLKVTLSEAIQNMAVERNALPTRANIRITAQFVLTRVKDGERLFGASSRGTGSHNILTSNYATLQAAESVRTQVVRQLAEDIQTQLAAFLLRGQRGAAR